VYRLYKVQDGYLHFGRKFKQKGRLAMKKVLMSCMSIGLVSLIGCDGNKCEECEECPDVEELPAIVGT